MSSWTKEELKKIVETDDLHVSRFRDDGVTYGTPTWIWLIVVDDALYVRAYNGPSSPCMKPRCRKSVAGSQRRDNEGRYIRASRRLH
jgi:hypothetical protein